LECSALFQVVDGAYNGAKLSFTDQAVLTDNGLDKNGGYSVPLEIMPSGQFEPLYRTTLSVQVQNSYFYFCAFHAIASSKTFFFHCYIISTFHVEGWRIASSSTICLRGSCNGAQWGFWGLLCTISVFLLSLW